MFFPVALPPGFFSGCTDYSAKGRYRTGDLIRWSQGVIQPVGGWRVRSDADPMDGVAQACLTWADDTGSAWIAVGTNTNLYASSRSGAVSDITPVGFTPGRQNAAAGGGYGAGLYGAGTYGTPRPDSTNILPAAVWTLDTFGHHLVGVMDEDATLYEWTLSTGTPAATIANAPSASALVTTQENILMALGADDGTSVNPRYIKWSAIQDNTDWTPTATNQARDAFLQTQGEIMLGKRIPGGVLILTDEGAFVGTYVGPPFVYTFARVGSGCGAVSRQCAAVTQNATYWMGRNEFYVFNGFTSVLPCDVHDYVFSDINITQNSKISAVLNSDFNEVWWFYPSGDSLEVNRYVVFNYLENIWYFGNLDRTCGTGSNGVLQYPVMVGTNGLIYDHEVGSAKDDRQPTLRSGPVEIGSGDQVILLSRFIPDERAEGVVEVTFHMRQWPNGAEESSGPYPATSPSDLRLTARQMEIEYIGDAEIDFRIGDFRFDGKPGGKR